LRQCDGFTERGQPGQWRRSRFAAAGADRLRSAGFSDVRVSGSGIRLAEVTWPKADITGDMPAQINELTEI
jgi:hypothetical protein